MKNKVDAIMSLVVTYADKRMMACLNKAPESHEDKAWAELVDAIEALAMLSSTEAMKGEAS